MFHHYRITHGGGDGYCTRTATRGWLLVHRPEGNLPGSGDTRVDGAHNPAGRGGLSWQSVSKVAEHYGLDWRPDAPVPPRTAQSASGCQESWSEFQRCSDPVQLICVLGTTPWWRRISDACTCISFAAILEFQTFGAVTPTIESSRATEMVLAWAHFAVAEKFLLVDLRQPSFAISAMTSSQRHTMKSPGGATIQSGGR